MSLRSTVQYSIVDFCDSKPQVLAPASSLRFLGGVLAPSLGFRVQVCFETLNPEP